MSTIHITKRRGTGSYERCERSDQNRTGDGGGEGDHLCPVSYTHLTLPTNREVIGGPAPIIYQKLGLNPSVDYGTSAIGIMNLTPPESAVIAADIAVKSGDVYLGFADRFTGTVIITGELADVTTALTEIVNYFRDVLGYVVCNITKR